MKSKKTYSEKNLSKCFKRTFIPLMNGNYTTHEEYIKLLNEKSELTVYKGDNFYPIGYMCLNKDCQYAQHNFSAEELWCYWSMFNGAYNKLERAKTDWFFRPWKIKENKK